MHIKHLPSSASSLSFSIFVFGANWACTPLCYHSELALHGAFIKSSIVVLDILSYAPYESLWFIPLLLDGMEHITGREKKLNLTNSVHIVQAAIGWDIVLYSGSFWAMFPFFRIFGENVLVILYTVLSGKCWNPHGYHMFVMAGGPVCKCRG